MTLGPLEYVMVAFEGHRFTGSLCANADYSMGNSQMVVRLC